MRNSFSTVSAVTVAMALVGSIACSTAIAGKKPMTGKELAFDKKKGNCLACHLIAGGKQAGNIAPPLIAMKARFPKKEELRAQIADPRAKNPNSMMPPFGPHGVLSEKEIDLVVDYVYGL
ncbi:MAG: sulfur oxidation c-type cytochrome SoxX [Cocleimonas sp.]